MLIMIHSKIRKERKETNLNFKKILTCNSVRKFLKQSTWRVCSRRSLPKTEKFWWVKLKIFSTKRNLNLGNLWSLNLTWFRETINCGILWKILQRRENTPYWPVSKKLIFPLRVNWFLSTCSTLTNKELRIWIPNSLSIL